MISDTFMDRIDTEYHKLIRSIHALKSNLDHETQKELETEFEELQNAHTTMEQKYAAWKQEDQEQNVPALTQLNDALTETRSIFEGLITLVKRSDIDWPASQTIEKSVASSYKRGEDPAYYQGIPSEEWAEDVDELKN